MLKVRDTLTSSSRQLTHKLIILLELALNFRDILIQEIQDEKYELLFGDGVNLEND